MLKEFRVDNFKSLINGIFRPQGMNLLLGLNNSGTLLPRETLSVHLFLGHRDQPFQGARHKN